MAMQCLTILIAEIYRIVLNCNRRYLKRIAVVVYFNHAQIQTLIQIGRPLLLVLCLFLSVSPNALAIRS